MRFIIRNSILVANCPEKKCDQDSRMDRGRTSEAPRKICCESLGRVTLAAVRAAPPPLAPPCCSSCSRSALDSPPLGPAPPPATCRPPISSSSFSPLSPSQPLGRPLRISQQWEAVVPRHLSGRAVLRADLRATGPMCRTAESMRWSHCRRRGG